MADTNSSFAVIIFIIYLTSAIYGLTAPILPMFLAEKNIDQFWTGIIFSSYAVFHVCSALLCGTIIERISHKRVMVVGTITLLKATFVFGVMDYLKPRWLIVMVGVQLCSLQGAASGFIFTAAYSYAAQISGDDVEKKISLIMTVGGLGNITGPFFGSLVYEYMGFACTFALFGASLALPICLIFIIVAPSELTDRPLERTLLRTALHRTDFLRSDDHDDRLHDRHRLSSDPVAPHGRLQPEPNPPENDLRCNVVLVHDRNLQHRSEVG